MLPTKFGFAQASRKRLVVGRLTLGQTTSTLKPTTGTLWGVARGMWNWLNLTGYNLLAMGTNLKYYIQNGTNGLVLRRNSVAYYNHYAQVRSPSPQLTGSPIITVSDAGHGAQTGDFVTYSGATSLGGNITATILNAEFQITATLAPSNNTPSHLQ
jgi:hypothetical protein